MKLSIKVTQPHQTRSSCLIFGVFEGKKLSPAAKHVDQASQKTLTKLLSRGDLKESLGQTLLVPYIPGILAERVLLVHCGKEKDFDDEKYATVLRKAFTALKPVSIKDAVCYLSDTLPKKDTTWKIRQAAIAAHDSIYQFDQLKSKKQKTALKHVTFHAANTKESAQAKKGMAEGEAIAAGMNSAKDLGNLPGNICTPTYLASHAKKLAKQFPKITTKVLTEANMKKLGMGSLLSVSNGSREPAKLITLEYKGGKATQKPVALVGKGVTFDAGGISIKPSGAMDEMKYDMLGAASVLGTIEAAAQLNLPLNIVGVVPATENLPDGQATKPGDIVTSMSGKTIEVINTDAEGRLILCDALTYTERFKPDVVIDIATLTGAIVVALGHHLTGIFTNHDALSKDLLKAGLDSNDQAWPMPIKEIYGEDMKSPFADIENCGSRWGGSITAAWFLSQFTEKFKWAHMDIAGTGWNSGTNKGATGRPVPLLVQYLLNRC